jgi:predicted 2-oxoglutarate/Fe(II)-dependent dioxygenase YbiX
VSVVIREGFLDAGEVGVLLHGAKTLKTWNETAKGNWTSRLAHAAQMEDRALAGQLVEIRQRVRSEIVRTCNLAAPLYADTLQIVRWPEGTEAEPHADAVHADGTPHRFPWRAFASVIYLNDDFDGGQIYFPTRRLAPAIRPGMLVFFPSTLDYLHGVTKVTRGMRFTVASFWTFDATKQDALPQ